MEKSCKTCINSDLDRAPDIINQACIDCCRLSNYEPEESMGRILRRILDSFNEDYMEES